MRDIPATSISLIEALAADSQSRRWKDLYTIYAPPMQAFLRAKFPSLEADDLIQETMLALMKALPDYHYTPDEKGHFHNYLMGILKHKAMDALAKRTREKTARATLSAQEAATRRPEREDEGEAEALQHEALEVAIAQLLADPDVNPLHRTVFERVTLQHEKPEEVARALGTSRGNVDVIKKRMIARLAALIGKLTGL